MLAERISSAYRNGVGVVRHPGLVSDVSSSR